jgi:GntR family transcriptional regulator/MocR family aminotransferase
MAQAGFDIESVVLDRRSPDNLHRQLYAQLRDMIENRALTSGSVLPSTRLLAQDLGIGRNSVITAYDQLALEGYLRLRKGAPPQVIDLPALRKSAPAHRSAVNAVSKRGQILQSQRYHLGQPGDLALHPGMPDPDHFPFNTWAKLLARRAKGARRDLFGAYHITGYPPLREAIARYLTASRGVNCTADQIVITNGAQSAFDLLARLLLDPGDTVWMEEPGYYGAAAAFLAAGVKLAPLQVGDRGWNLEPPRVQPRVVYVTPSCHHPLGAVMTMEQRFKLLQLAEQWNSWIIEDDYDSEYRFQGQPIPALQGLDATGRVVYVSTFAKILFSAMRLGFMVLPPQVSESITAALSTTGHFAPLLAQAALADFMNEGHFTRHLRRMRRLYAARREAFVSAFEHILGDWLTLPRTESGLQLAAVFHSAHDDRTVAARAQKLGINVSALSIQYAHGHPQQGLVLGFAASDERVTVQAMRKLRKILSER